MLFRSLFLAKADEGQIVPSRQQFSLNHMVEELVEFYHLVADDKGVELTHTGTATMTGDPLMIRRAISNLLSNAIRHTPSGGCIAIRIVQTDSSLVTLTIENTGATIPPQHLPRLFDRFYRADASRHRLSDGAGLGLAITQSILRAHGGSISVRSENGITAFELLVPAR